MQDILAKIKDLSSMFGFSKIGDNIYLRPAMNGLEEVYLSFLDEYLIFVTENNALHLTYEEVMYNIELYRENATQGFSERTIYSQALEMLKK